MIYVLDACAMIAYLRDERGAELVEAAFLDPDTTCAAHSVNLCEVYYDFCRARNEPEALEAMVRLRALSVVFREDLSPEFWQAAGRLKAIQRRVSLADCFAITLAQRLGATVLTSDHHEFDSIAAQKICSITFIR